MNRIHIKQISFAAITSLLLAGCASDELADGAVQTLPDGKYPLEIASVKVTGEVQTRVSESSDGSESIWDGGEIIAVKTEGTTNPGTYKINTDGTATAETQTYWSKTTDNVTAWYPETPTIDLADQSAKLAYAMKATISSASYKSNVNLDFKHQLAKIRVLLTGTADMQDGTVQVKGYTTGTISNGDVTGNNEGWITMKKCSYDDGHVCYEANVIPEYELSEAAFQVTAQNGIATPMKLDAPLSVSERGKIYEVTLTVNKKGTQTVDLTDASTIYENDIYTVAANASVVIDGKGRALEKRIVINEGAHVVLKNVKLNGPTSNYEYHQYKPVIEVLGTATITFCGEDNVITSCVNDLNDAISVTGENATLTINGTLKDKLVLNASSSSNATGLGAKNSSNLVINGGTIIATAGDDAAAIGSNYNSTCGNITINGGNITANAGKDAAAIGGGSNAGQCGDITITGGTVIANGSDKGRGSVGIGSGTATQTSMPTCGFINISGGTITATGGSGEYGGAGIGAGVNTAYCKNITISGGTVIAIGKSGTKLMNGEYGSGAGIGTSCYGQCDNITISGGETTVTATAGGDKSYDIGLGYDPETPNLFLMDGVVTIDPNANVTASKIYYK